MRTDPKEIPSELIEALRQAAAVTVLTGAGVSAESGVPTFRDAQTGVWSAFNAEDLATPDAFERNPRRVWEWYAWRRKLLEGVLPNAGHYALAEMERRVTNFVLVTQNVDGLHQEAGNTDVIELHGNIRRTKCFERGHLVPEWAETDEVPPRCPECGGRLRPDVVWFNELLPEQAIIRAIDASRACDLFFSIGTSSKVYPAASLPWEAIDRGADVVEINPSPTSLTPRSRWAFAVPSGEFLPALIRETWG